MIPYITDLNKQIEELKAEKVCPKGKTRQILRGVKNAKRLYSEAGRSGPGSAGRRDRRGFIAGPDVCRSRGNL